MFCGVLRFMHKQQLMIGIANSQKKKKIGIAVSLALN
jgi:hypothetical protein